jgi:hypothetical protein
MQKKKRKRGIFLENWRRGCILGGMSIFLYLAVGGLFVFGCFCFLATALYMLYEIALDVKDLFKKWFK